MIFLDKFYLSAVNINFKTAYVAFFLCVINLYWSTNMVKFSIILHNMGARYALIFKWKKMDSYCHYDGVISTVHRYQNQYRQSSRMTLTELLCYNLLSWLMPIYGIIAVHHTSSISCCVALLVFSIVQCVRLRAGNHGKLLLKWWQMYYRPHIITYYNRDIFGDSKWTICIFVVIVHIGSIILFCCGH